MELVLLTVCCCSRRSACLPVYRRFSLSSLAVGIAGVGYVLVFAFHVAGRFAAGGEGEGVIAGARVGRSGPGWSCRTRKPEAGCR